MTSSGDYSATIIKKGDREDKKAVFLTNNTITIKELLEIIVYFSKKEKNRLTI
jgi:hypothetical protein